MQCPECHYITFKVTKKCGNCNFDFKHHKHHRAPEAFTIHEGAAMVAEPVGVGEAATYAADTGFGTTPSGDFNLDLSDALAQAGVSAAAETVGVPTEEDLQPVESLDSLEFDPDAELAIDDLEVEGLGFEDLVETASGTGEEETSEISPDTAIEPEADVVEPAVDLEPEPGVDIAEPAVELEPELEAAVEVDLDTSEESGELDLGTADEEPELVVEPETSEISLDLDEVPVESESPAPEPEPGPETDEPEIKLEIDSSDAPLSGEKTDEPEVEIEDLGLSLEENDDKKE